MRRPRLYVDANVFVAAMEAADQMRGLARGIFALRDEGAIDIVTSQLTLSEALVGPMKVADHELITAYEAQIIGLGADFCVPVTLDVLRMAARLRAASRGLKLPDAIHVASARSRDCDATVSEDRRLERQGDVPVVALEAGALNAFFAGFRP